MTLRRTLQALTALALVLSLAGQALPALAGPAQPPDEPLAKAGVRGPFVSAPVVPVVWNGDLRDLPQLRHGGSAPLRDMPTPGVPAGRRPIATIGEVADPLAQAESGNGQMPAPLTSFDGLDRTQSGGWRPPDTNGDVGVEYYVQTVNIAMGVYDKETGQELVAISFDALFDGTGTPCDTANRGDVISLYDPLAGRWLVTDFSLPSTGPVYECIAVSQSEDPISGGWYFYAYEVDSDGHPWHDYPKWGIWPDAYYMSANMFDPWSGAWVWAFDRAAMLNGQPMTAIRFETGTAYASLLPGNMRGDPPPAGSPNYYASIDFPNLLHIWEFHVDWANPANSTFTGPVDLTVAPFTYIDDIPQPGTTQTLDSLGDRLMFSLHYRNMGDHESLWVNHTVGSNGVAGVRWYEVRDPGGTPVLYQQGTYQPDSHHRWMGSVATDQDGNMAVGYSVASSALYPSIRYAGRLADDILGTLPQGEASLIEGNGSQTGTNRWGDYSMMTVDPVDDCTFWYTQEYFPATGSNWYTRIGSFRFPTCGLPKGWIEGTVYDAETLAPIAGAPVSAEGITVTLTAETNASGRYRLTLPSGVYTLTAGPLLFGYPDPTTVAGVAVTAGVTTTVDIPLAPAPYLVEDGVTVDDDVPGGNANGFPEPGERDLRLWESIANTGATTATNVSAHLVALTPGVTVTVAEADYPDIPDGATRENLTPFLFSLDPTVPCGARLDFEKVVVADQGVYTLPFSLRARVELPRDSFFFDNVESGVNGWTHGGTGDLWAISTELSHSPTHAWSDSPGGNYGNNVNAWLRSPTFDLRDQTDFELSFWHRYALETGWDFGYVEYSLDGGSSWTPFPVQYTGSSGGWVQESFDVPMFEDQASVAFRFRITSDTSVTDNGWHIDDVDLTYIPFVCTYPTEPPGVPTLLAPPDGTVTTTQQITLTWAAGAGWAADGYNVDVDGEVITTTETSLATTLGLGEHTWAVRAYNAAGYSAYTDAWSLTVGYRLYMPIVMRNR